MNGKPFNHQKPTPVTNNRCQSKGGTLIGCTIPPDAKLLAAGWERRFIADARMARDAVDSYSELGYEVRLEPVNADELKDECSGCKALFRQFKAVYTRKKK
ncbi:MAG: hypothetical protein ACE5HI_04085 [bacterium]